MPSNRPQYTLKILHTLQIVITYLQSLLLQFLSTSHHHVFSWLRFSCIPDTLQILIMYLTIPPSTNFQYFSWRFFFLAESDHVWQFPLKLLHPQNPPNSETFIFLVSRGTNSNWDFCLIWICTEEFAFLDLVDFGVVAFWVEIVIYLRSRRRSDLKYLDLHIYPISGQIFEWRGLCLRNWKLVLNFWDSRENVFDMYGDSRENLLKNFVFVIIWSPISSVRGIPYKSSWCPLQSLRLQVLSNSHDHVFSWPGVFMYTLKWCRPQHRLCIPQHHHDVYLSISRVYRNIAM